MQPQPWSGSSGKACGVSSSPLIFAFGKTTGSGFRFFRPLRASRCPCGIRLPDRITSTLDCMRYHDLENWKITESQNHSGWQRPPRSSSPAVTPTPPCLLNPVPKGHIQTGFGPLQGWGLPHCPRQLLQRPTALKELTGRMERGFSPGGAVMGQGGTALS